ncbi:response regulator transcription factor [Paraburkholderia bryophila]|uniref:response regulator transcription factor n=1 Tax=Paraburkholderia bryophila TaxID=420952 RepID=UPI002348F525|nr:response regulator transcription factor [Paraburkholderia bryophila]WCM22569.1 response regulator transcription factor [Paraburkholderia bryophila]
MRIAILEDDPEMAAFLSNTLSSAGHSCHQFASGRDFVRTLRRQTFDLITLDWQVPDMTGEQVLHWVRQHVADPVPVIFITSYARDNDMMSTLNAGADDYVVKPVAAGVLLARVDSLLRRAYKVNPSSVHETYGDFEFDLASEQVRCKGNPVALTRREFLLALLLFQNIGRPLTRAYIFEVVWKQAPDIRSRTMDTHVSLVRSKLSLRPENGYRLASVYAYGYRLEQIPAATSPYQSN